MKASVGDRIVIASYRIDGPLRDGRIVECRHADGSPPYLVRWSDGYTGLYFPGPDAKIHHYGDAADAGRTDPDVARHVKTWRVELHVFESGDDTTAHAVLVAEVPGIDATGAAHREPELAKVPEIGDEIAVARALRRLSDRLLGVASEDITAAEGHPVVLEQ
jgi:Domain of unknown function (DUF1876)/Domain of unknown function (DUF1918)